MSARLNKRILIISHGHPEVNKGGAEVAAFNMFKEFEGRGEDVYFLARTGQMPHGGAAFSSRNSGREILFHTMMDDGFLFSNIKTRHLWQEFRDLLLLIKPDVVHLHHYFLLGIEIMEEIRQSLPNCKIVLTLHEYLAICHQKGLMIKTNGKLCYKASPRDCHGCFPEKNPGDFFLREQYIKRMFSVVDHFVSPSEFLRQRYIEWGIAPEAISMIENGQPEVEVSADVLTKTEDSLVKFAYFGQINPYKGIDVLIAAVNLVPRELRRKMMIEIHGANLESQSGVYQKKVQGLLKKVKGNVHFHGPYEGAEMPKLLSNVDWAVVPSVWWENSPMVIQEAFRQKVPLIVSDIGGMAEKVRHGVDGFHFRHGSPADLADTISRCIKQRELRIDMVKNICEPLSISDCVDKHVVFYQ